MTQDWNKLPVPHHPACVFVSLWEYSASGITYCEHVAFHSPYYPNNTLEDLQTLVLLELTMENNHHC